jgi:PIN domain nuclease of toxin-antitoxin system
MRLLLDTHVLLWWLDDHPRLGAAARRHIADRRHQVYFSAASVWEASIKESKGSLRLSDDFDAKLAAEPLLPLAVTHQHGRKVAALPLIHKDPFDRVLVAQCLLEGMTLITGDKVLAGYGIPLIPACAAMA